MSSVHRQPGSPCWIAHFYDHTRRRRAKSTRIPNTDRNKPKAAAIAAMWEEAASRARDRVPSAEWLLHTANEIFEGAGMTGHSITTWTKYSGSILEMKRAEYDRGKLARKTLDAWERDLGKLALFLGPESGRDMRLITAVTMQRWYEGLRKEISAASAGQALAKVRFCFERARNEGMIDRDPAAMVRADVTDRIVKDTFTVAQLEKLVGFLKKTGQTEWVTMVYLGLCTGARIIDCARMRWPAPGETVLRFRPQKANRKGRKAPELQVSIVEPLSGWLERLEGHSVFLCPTMAAKDDSASLAKGFGKLLDAAGVTSVVHTRENGRMARTLTFHSLRHTLSTWLMETNAPDVLARQITGHEDKDSAEIYRHVHEPSIRIALNKALARVKKLG